MTSQRPEKKAHVDAVSTFFNHLCAWSSDSKDGQALITILVSGIVCNAIHSDLHAYFDMFLKAGFMKWSYRSACIKWSFDSWLKVLNHTYSRAEVDGSLNVFFIRFLHSSAWERDRVACDKMKQVVLDFFVAE